MQLFRCHFRLIEQVDKVKLKTTFKIYFCSLNLTHPLSEIQEGQMFPDSVLSSLPFLLPPWTMPIFVSFGNRISYFHPFMPIGNCLHCSQTNPFNVCKIMIL